ncbi:MAG TPA: hypothetical protein VGK75_17725, partial [Casimicrobiaceae bacterium]
QIGKPLFRRVHRALQLTRAGEELYRATDEALTMLDAAVDQVAESGKSGLMCASPRATTNPISSVSR